MCSVECYALEDLLCITLSISRDASRAVNLRELSHCLNSSLRGSMLAPILDGTSGETDSCSVHVQNSSVDAGAAARMFDMPPGVGS